jgi:hypothetical protein
MNPGGSADSQARTSGPVLASTRPPGRARSRMNHLQRRAAALGAGVAEHRLAVLAVQVVAVEQRRPGV